MTLLLTGMLVFGRVGGLILSLPMIGAMGIPRWVSVFTGLAMAVLLTPLVPAVDAAQDGLLGVFVLGMAGEFGLGVVMGTTVRAAFAAIAMGGEIAASQTGMQMASLFDPLQHSTDPVIATLASWIAGAVFIALNLHNRCFELVALSFHMVPPATAGLPMAGAVTLIDVVVDAFTLGVQLAGPVIAMMMGFQVFLGLLTRLAPKMNIYFAVGMTGSNAIGALVIAVSLPWMIVAHMPAIDAAIDAAATALALSGR